MAKKSLNHFNTMDTPYIGTPSYETKHSIRTKFPRVKLNFAKYDKPNINYSNTQFSYLSLV